MATIRSLRREKNEFSTCASVFGIVQQSQVDEIDNVGCGGIWGRVNARVSDRSRIKKEREKEDDGGASSDCDCPVLLGPLPPPCQSPNPRVCHWRRAESWPNRNTWKEQSVSVLSEVVCGSKHSGWIDLQILQTEKCFDLFWMNPFSSANQVWVLWECQFNSHVNCFMTDSLIIFLIF